MSTLESRLGQALACEWLKYDVVNYAMQQNFVPVVQKIALRNLSERDLHGLVVRVQAEPEFAPIWQKAVDVVPAGKVVDLGPVHVQVSGTFLAELTERMTGELTLSVARDEEVLYRETSPLTLLAYDQWGGLSAMPEMAAAFIMPNHPAVSKVIGEAAPILEKWTGSPSFDAYQSNNPNRIRHQAAAIFAAIQAKQPIYCVAPASFEEVGQRVRLPDAVLGTQMGNCLDLTLLYAACLEAVGLHPLVIFTEGHAFPGVWLIPETFAETVQDDRTLLAKRLAAGVHEISIAESTLMCAGHRDSYQDAEQAAIGHLNDPDGFFGFIDVRRARASAIRPIPIRIPTPNGWEIARDEQGTPGTAEAPEEMKIHARPAEAVSIPVTKQKQWERRLLDLTLRNTLLNFRLTKSALPLLHARLSELEDALSEGQEFQLLSKPSDWDNTYRSADLFQSVSKDHPLNVLIQQEFLQKRLRANAGDRELLEKAIHLYRSAKVSLEENGANTLFLALGLLKWYESPASEKPRFAPIVLVPVELTRKTSSANFILRVRDEEPQINITLLEMLRQDFGSQIGGLDPLPRDEKGIDLAGIFTAIRHVIMRLPRWDVVESAFLGLFSFSRFVMWNDIRSRAEDLAKNKVVASLMSGRLEWQADDPFPDPASLDENYAPNRLLLPISADSSQIVAVSAANQGGSFVLHGPPGTGKSQTITNMIASALAENKTVLFVAEKMAALSVVQSRLEQIGLGPFCLELHSNKSTKKAVLDQLRRTLEAARSASPEEWTRQAERLAASRSELNGYVASLHRKRGFGASLHEAIARYGSMKEAPVLPAYDPAAVGSWTQDLYLSWSDHAKELRVAGEAAGHPAGHVWSDAACTAYTPSLRAQVEEALAGYSAALGKIKQTHGELSSVLGSAASQPTREELQGLAEVGERLQAMPAVVPSAFLGADELEPALQPIAQAVRYGKARDEARSRITARFSREALAFDAAPALAEWRQAELKWFLPKLLKQNRIYKQLKAMASANSPFLKSHVPETLQLMIDYQAEAAGLKQAGASASGLLGTLWNDGEADWEAVQALCDWGRQLDQALLRLHRDGNAARLARKRIAEAASAGTVVFQERHRGMLANYTTVFRECMQLEDRLAGLLAVDFRAMDENRAGQAWLEFRAQKTRQWSEAIDSLREWCSWRLVRERAAGAGLSSVVTAYERGELRHDQVAPAFERAWWRAAIDHVLSEEKELASFSGRLFEDKIKTFQEISERFERLTRQEIAARLSANIPPPSNQASSNSEAGILLRAIRSGGRGMSLRRLFEQIPNLLNRLCPCVLMSPMSVAQYLDPKYAPFDLVVFDEASQLPTSEAVGAMARGRGVIVVGDPKQLPPTSFFSSTTGDEEDDGVVPEDLESILDDCLALGMPQAHLLWHYRSRHESLIAFSNRHFYENKLLTFPSPFERKSSVRWHPVEGYYDRGKTKQNRAEAEQVVAEISRRLRDAEGPRRSIGVVTFNSIQQTLIEDLLDEAYRRDGELERLAAQLHEPIFIKNLENVQGDERDVILFSIGYGPDAAGKVVLNFGPLNREGGWRRLNVAVSRARHEMHVFSTLRSEHLDVSRTRSHGVGVLKSFLEYAEKGQNALGLRTDQLKPEETGIETQIAEALTKEGHKVDLHVGASGYRMDLAVVDSEQPDAYVLAILCDGDSYRSGRTARDREMLREHVLRQLGWRIHRVWAMDWLDNPAKEMGRILEAIEAAKANQAPIKEQGKVQIAAVQSAAPSVGAHEADTAPSALSTWKSAYRAAVLPAVDKASEEFYSTANTRIVQEQIARVVQEEGPISRSLLHKRVLQAWGMTRSGARIERRFDETIGAMKLRKTSWDDADYFWPDGAEPAEYGVYRVSEGEQERRNAEDLPPEEIANAVKEVLFNHGSLPVEDLIRETVKALGYSRTGSALDRALRHGLQAAISKGNAEMDNGRAFYRKANDENPRGITQSKEFR